MQLLDEWLHYVDTEEIRPLFEKSEREYNAPSLKDIKWDELPPAMTEVLREKNLLTLETLTSLDNVSNILELLNRIDEKTQLRAVYSKLLDIESCNRCSVNKIRLVRHLLEFLPKSAYLTTLFLQSQTWESHKQKLENDLIRIAPSLLRELVLSTNSLPSFVRNPISMVLENLRQISIQHLAELVELIALSVRDPEVALDLLLGCIEPEISRLLVGRLPATQQFVGCLIGIALDHIDEASSVNNSSKESLELSLDGYSDGYEVVKSVLRIDSPGGALKVGDHVRLTATNPPQNAPFLRPYSMDAIVLSSEIGSATFRCLHHLPPFLKECAWNLCRCGSFVTSKTMFDAVTTFYSEKQSCCGLYASFVGLRDRHARPSDAELPFTPNKNLNEGQNRALQATMTHPLTFIWGPPGTGKTHSIVVILEQLLNALPQKRFLVTAPTHNAVDNILLRFIAESGPKKANVKPIRVSTNVSKFEPTFPAII